MRISTQFYRTILVLLLPIGLMVLCACDAEQEAAASRPVVFMDSFKVFEGFEMKKDYDLMLEEQLTAEQHTLDSLQTSAGNPDILAHAKAGFEEKFEQLSQQYTQEVYARLNMYIQEFGREKKYGMVLGSGGQGNVMYVDKKQDVTQELLAFINQKYARR